jgi:hypothetical protein
METVAINNGHVIINDRGRLVEDLTRLNTRFRFAHEKPGIAISIGQLSAQAAETNIHGLPGISGSIAVDRGPIGDRDRSSRLLTSVSYSGRSNGCSRYDWMPSVCRCQSSGATRPLAGIRLEPAVDVTARGTLDALNMDVDVVSSAGSARGPLVGHFGGGSKSLEGHLDVRDVNMAPILNREEWKTQVTGRARFDWQFSPAEVDFTFAGSRAEGFGYQAANVTAKGVYQPALLRFDASGAAYGASATTRAEFRFATPRRPLTYSLDGTFRNLDMRRRLSARDAEARSQAAGAYHASNRAAAPWSGSAARESIVECAVRRRTRSASVAHRQLSYSAAATWRGSTWALRGASRVQWLDDGA